MKLHNKKYMATNRCTLLGCAIAATLVGAPIAAGSTPQLPADHPAAVDAAKGAAVKGRVIDSSTGQPLVGVRISAVNSSASAVTDDGGEFTLTAPSRTLTLKAEISGYHTLFVPVKGRGEVAVKMAPGADRTELDHTFRAPSVAGRNEFGIGETVADNSVADLQGNLLSIARSGMPGSGHTVFVDGLHSLNTSSQPLYVVDGVIWSADDNALSTIGSHFDNPLSLISPDDIEKIYVMRNGTAIYGAKAGNGVVVIETKRARSQATVIDAFSRMGWSGGVKKLPVMSADQYRLYASDIVSGKYTSLNTINRLSFLNDDPKSAKYAETHNDTDWLDLVTRRGLMMNYGVNVRGGDDRALYGFSLGYTRNEGNLKETSFSRINVRFNSDINLWDNVTLRFDVAYAQADHSLFSDGLNSLASPYFMSLVKSPLYHKNILTADGAVTAKYADVDELGVGNPMAVIDLASNEIRNYRFNLNAAPRWQVLPSLALEGLVHYTFNKVKENSFLPDYGVAETPLLNNTGETYFTVRNSVQNLMNRRTSFGSALQLAWHPLSTVENDFNLTGGFRYLNDTYISSLGEGYNTSSDNVTDLGYTTRRFTSGFDTQWRSMSWYANASYTYLQKYIIEAQMALETSSRFGRDARNSLSMAGVPWGVFPSVNAAWLISSEEWMAGAEWVNLLKPRIGWELTGNDNLPYNANRTFYDSTFFLGNAYGTVLSAIANNRLTWEQTSTLRAGVDASLFDNHWDLSFDLYTSTTRNLLVNRTLNEETGLTGYWTNGGTLSNRGFNFSTNVRAFHNRDWRLDLGGSIGCYRNEITALDAGAFTTSVAGGTVLTEVGHPAGVFYGYKTEGVFSTAADAEKAGLSIRNANGSYSRFEAGDMHFADRNGDRLITPADREIIGDPTPDFYGNVNFKLQWKQFSLGSLFTYCVGNDVYNALRANLEAGADIHNQSSALANRWVAPGQVTDIPRATYGDPMGNARFSDRWIEDGSYLRWKSLSLDYKIPVASTFVQGVTLSLEASNLATFTRYLGPDPEFSYGASPLYLGVDAGLVPQVREYVFGIKINL